MRGDQRTFKIRIEDTSLAEARTKMVRLREDILDAVPDLHVDIEKDDETTLDFGTVLVLVLGTPAAIAIAKGTAPAITAIAKGIADYLRRDRATIAIECGDGKIIATGISGDDAARIAEALSKCQ
jgi:hypothetical protein